MCGKWVARRLSLTIFPVLGEILSEVDFRFVFRIFFLKHFDINSLKNVVPLGYGWIEQNLCFLLELFSKLFRDTIKPFTYGFVKVNDTTHSAFQVFSKCKTKTKQKPLKL